MNGNRYYGVRVEGAKYGVGFGSALAIAISYTANHSILWAIIHGIFGHGPMSDLSPSREQKRTSERCKRLCCRPGLRLTMTETARSKSHTASPKCRG